MTVSNVCSVYLERKAPATAPQRTAPGYGQAIEELDVSKRICCVDDCEREAYKRKWCGMHYQRGKAAGTITTPTPEQAAWENVKPDAVPPECPVGAKLIPLTDGLTFAIVDADDYGWLTQWRWWPQPHGDGYAYRHIYTPGEDGYTHYAGSLLMHRVLMQTPDGLDTDHINRNRLDNRRGNLRCVDRAQNNYNTAIWVNNTSGHKGVSWNKRTKSWRAYIGGGGSMGSRRELGHFKNIEDAVAARLAAEEVVIDKCA